MYHEWNDEWFNKHGNDLYRAESYIRKFVKRWSGCYLMTKEKYGTIRYEHLFPPGTSYRPTKLDLVLTKIFGTKVVTFLTQDISQEIKIPRVQWSGSWLYYQWIKLGKIVLKIAIRKAIKKFPDVREEILDDYDNGEYL